MRCIWCDDLSHRRSDCGSYTDALKEGIVTFKEGRIRDATTDEPLVTNFGRGGMKRLWEENLGKTSFIHAIRADTYHIEAGQSRDVIKDNFGGKLPSGRPRASAFIPQTWFYPRTGFYRPPTR
jgi:hypothetical protein